MNRITITLTVNGHRRTVTTEPNKTLLYLLRDDLGLHGAKDACGGEGECGACTVLMDGQPVNSCLVLAGQADGHDIVTIEGLAGNGHLHPPQRSFVEAGAVQCGFCRPGADLAAATLLDGSPSTADEEIREAQPENLCGWTVYVKLMTEIHVAADEQRYDG